MGSTRTPKPPSLEALARSRNPLEDRSAVIERLLAAAKESKYLEWKAHPPTGPSVTSRSKYRMVKAALSFANWEGGFIVFGVNPAGSWVGLDEQELAAVDPAAIYELVNGCIFPEIADLNYIDFDLGDRRFAILHIPPSPSAPHVTTKQLVEKTDDGQIKVIVEKHALYCRQGAKCDLATPQQHHQILSRHAERLRAELLRRVREVPIAVPASGPGASVQTGVAITFARLSKDPTAPAVRVSREEGASGTFLHEELSDGLFEEINNVVEASNLLARGRMTFSLGEGIYYRVYAERHHVVQPQKTVALLAHTGLHEFYAPCLYWVLQVDVSDVVGVMRQEATEMRTPQIRALMRLVTLLGPRTSSWLWEAMSRRWSAKSQAPDYFWSFKEMRDKPAPDSRLTALRSTTRATIHLPDGISPTIGDILADPTFAHAQLTKACIAVYEGKKEFRQSARHLDLLAYGLDVATRAAAIEAELGL